MLGRMKNVGVYRIVEESDFVCTYSEMTRLYTILKCRGFLVIDGKVFNNFVGISLTRFEFDEMLHHQIYPVVLRETTITLSQQDANSIRPLPLEVANYLCQTPACDRRKDIEMVHASRYHMDGI